MEKKESIKEYLQKMLDRWNKYDELDGFVAENFRVDLEKTLEYWDLRIADNKQELDKAREEGYKKGYIDGQIEKINKPKPVVSEFDKTSYLN